MTACTNCGPEPPPIKIQNITLWDKDKNKGLENITNNLLNHETNQGTDTETDTEKIRDILGKTIFFSDIERLNSNESRPKRSLDNNQVSKQVDNTTPLVLPHFESRKIQLIPLEVDPSDSNHMTQAIMKENTNEGPPRLERVAQIVTNIVHSPRSLSYGRVQYPIYDSSITSTKQTSQPWGVTNKLIIRPTRYRSQYRFPPETNYYSNGGPYSSDYYQSPVSPPKYRKSKKLPAKLIDVYDHHDNQYEYIEMDINHEGKQVPKKPPKYMRSKYKNQNQGSSYGGYRDHYKKQTPSRPHKKGSSKSYYAQKDSYGYDNDNDRGGGFDYQEGPDSKRNPDYKDSNEEDDFNSQEDTYDRGSSETSGPKKSKFIPSQPAPGGGHYYRPPVEGSTPPRTPHKFIPVPKTLEEYHQLHGTKFLNSYKPDEDDEFTFHYPSDAHGNVDAQYDEEETSPPRFRPSHPTSNIRENKDTRLPSYNDGYKDTRPPSFDGGFKDTRLPSFDKGFKDTRSPSFDDGFKDDRLPSFDGFKDSTSPSYAPTYDGGDFNDPKTPTSFMSVAFGKPDLEGNAETRIRHTSPGRKLKYSQPLPSTQSEAYESNDSSGGDLSSKELQTFLDQVKTHVYDDHGNLKSDYKSDLKSDLKSSYFDASIDPYKNSHSGKKSKKGYNSNAKDLLENNHGNFNKKHNYRNRNSYSTSGNSKSNFNNGDSFSRKKHGWRGSGDGGFGYKETNDHDSFDGNLFDKGEGKPPGFKEDLFGKDRMKSLIPSESNNQQVTGRSNPGRHSRRVKIRVMKTNRVLEENETLVKPIVADDGAATTVETSSVVPTNVTIGNATAD